MGNATESILAVARRLAGFEFSESFKILVHHLRKLDVKYPLDEAVHYTFDDNATYGKIPMATIPVSTLLVSLPVIARWSLTEPASGGNS